MTPTIAGVTSTTRIRLLLVLLAVATAFLVFVAGGDQEVAGPPPTEFGELVILVQSDMIESVEFTQGSSTVSAVAIDGDELTSVMPPGFSDDFAEVLLDAEPVIHVSTIVPDPGIQWGTILGSAVPIMLMLVIVWAILSRMGGGGGKKFTKKTRKSSKELEKVTFADVAGAQEAVVELAEIKEFLTDPKRFRDIGAKIPKGVLLYGPPGTGKTMTAALLGKSTGQPVYKIDLSMVVSKYIGETEKNLAKVFDQAENQQWILFFDEADSLFGKRTQVNSANDRFGNQEIGYLLQRIEDFPGVVILASNLKENIDEAFTRRFQSMVEFRMPGVEERYKLWTQSFSEKLPLDTSIDLRTIAEKYELSGGVMMNVVRKATLGAVSRSETEISLKALELAVRQELQKEGIVLS